MMFRIKSLLVGPGKTLFQRGITSHDSYIIIPLIFMIISLYIKGINYEDDEPVLRLYGVTLKLPSIPNVGDKLGHYEGPG